MANCKTIAIYNQKGGVGKATTTVNHGINIGLAKQENECCLLLHIIIINDFIIFISTHTPHTGCDTA